MKLNLDYYKEELDNKIILEEYYQVLNKIKSGETDFSKKFDEDEKIENILAFSEIRENILNWYRFKENSTILELNANYGEITGLLCEKAKKVTAIENSYKYSQIIEQRHNDKQNLELIVGNLENISLEEKYNYAIIVGIAADLEKYLNYAKEHLKEDGTIIIAVNNKFGMKSWTTIKDKCDITSNNENAISKNDLDKLIEGWNYRYYYPLPDYKMPNIIYTEKHVPTIADINRNLTYNDGDVNFKENQAYIEILKHEPEKILEFVNSFLIEISKGRIIDESIKFVTFSNIRKDKYRIKTIIKEDEVYKTNINKKSKKHLSNIKKNIDMLNKLNINILDSYNKDEIISKYCRNLTLDKILIEELKNNQVEEFLENIKKYTDFLKSKLEIIEFESKNIFQKYKIKCDDEVIRKLTFVKYGFWDLIFQNCFVIDGEYYFYDQEWFDENVPVEYIIYRTIQYFNEIDNYISKEEIYDKLNLLEYITIFKELDDKIQEEIREELFWNIHTKDELVRNKIHRYEFLRTTLEDELKILKENYENLNKNYENLKNNNENLNVDNENLKNNYDKLKSDYEDLENKYKAFETSYSEKNNELQILKNSFSWKITKPLRKISGFRNKK